ncbi:MAG: sigma factor [Raoultibacter sp.]
MNVDDSNIVYAEDVLQNAYLKAWLHSDSLRIEANYLAWLNRIVYTECMSYLRSRKRQPLCMVDELLV